MWHKLKTILKDDWAYLSTQTATRYSYLFGLVASLSLVGLIGMAGVDLWLVGDYWGAGTALLLGVVVSFGHLDYRETHRQREYTKRLTVILRNIDEQNGLLKDMVQNYKATDAIHRMRYANAETHIKLLNDLLISLKPKADK